MADATTALRQRETGGPPDPQWIELQRQGALTALAAAQQAVRLGQMATASTKLLLVGERLDAMATGERP